MKRSLVYEVYPSVKNLIATFDGVSVKTTFVHSVKLATRRRTANGPKRTQGVANRLQNALQSNVANA